MEVKVQFLQQDDRKCQHRGAGPLYMSNIDTHGKCSVCVIHLILCYVYHLIAISQEGCGTKKIKVILSCRYFHKTSYELFCTYILTWTIEYIVLIFVLTYKIVHKKCCENVCWLRWSLIEMSWYPHNCAKSKCQQLED